MEFVGFGEIIYNSFICNCPSGVNTTGNCFLSPYWSATD